MKKQQAPKTRYKEVYDKEIVPALQKKYSYKNTYEVPRLTKIVLNMGVGEATQNRAFLENAVNDLTLIAGQKAQITRAKKSNASFKIRDDQAIGCKVTLRGQRMYEFLDRLITIALPRVRDFRNEEREKNKKTLIVELKYSEGKGVIRTINRVSKPGRRVYSNVRSMPRFYNGLGVMIVSTPGGVMADHKARAANVGGEILCQVF